MNSGEWFAGLEPAFQRAVLGSSRAMVLAAGEPIFRRGDPGDGIYCVISGAVRFGTVAPSGKESIVGLAEAPQWFGEVALFDGGARTHDAWADITSTLLHLPSASPDENSRRRPGRVAIHGTVAGTKASDRALFAGGHGAGTSEGAADALSHQPVRGIRRTESRAVSRQTVNELLRDLERELIIQCQRGGVRILDPRQLRDAAQPSP